MRGSDNGHEYLVIHTWETTPPPPPQWALSVIVTQVRQNWKQIMFNKLNK